MRATQLEIYIDKIELNGFDSMPVTELKAAIEHHLVNKLNVSKLIEQATISTKHDCVEGSQFTLAPKMHTTQIGESIAGSISHGLEHMQVTSTSQGTIKAN